MCLSMSETLSAAAWRSDSLPDDSCSVAPADLIAEKATIRISLLAPGGDVSRGLIDLAIATLRGALDDFNACLADKWPQGPPPADA